MPVIRLAQQPVPGLVLEVVNASGGRRCESKRESAGDERVEEPVRLSAVRNPGKRAALPACRADLSRRSPKGEGASAQREGGRQPPACSTTSTRKRACRSVKLYDRRAATGPP
jgi:hypothetical protein